MRTGSALFIFSIRHLPRNCKQRLDFACIFADKRQFFRPAQPLQGVFPLQGCAFIGGRFHIAQGQRSPAPGVFCPPALRIGPERSLQSIGDAGVEGPVGTFEYIDRPNFFHVAYNKTGPVIRPGLVVIVSAAECPAAGPPAGRAHPTEGPSPPSAATPPSWPPLRPSQRAARHSWPPRPR